MEMCDQKEDHKPELLSSFVGIFFQISTKIKILFQGPKENSIQSPNIGFL